jgi:hypothetical protein
MANREKLVTRIQKLLALASSNPSAAEAEVALLQARKLMAEHDVTEDDVVEAQDQDKDKVDAAEVMASGRMNDLKVAILSAIANAHRCTLLRSRSRLLGTKIKVVGFERDRAVVVALNDWAWRSVSAEADRFVKSQREAAKARRGYDTSRSDMLSVRRSFVLGFASGLSSAYKRQVDANPQWALVLATPVEVKDYMEEATNGRTFKSNRSGVDEASYNAGHKAGAEHVAATSQKNAPRLAALPKMLSA